MDHKVIWERRYQFYLELKAKAENQLGPSNSLAKDFKRYKKNFDLEILKTKEKAAVSSTFFKSLKNQNFLLFGDFHSEPQSMRSMLRVCRKFKTNEIILALECVQSSHQSVLEKYLKGELSEIDFLRRTKWVKNWNFPFDFVRPLFQWAIENNVQVYGVNSLESSLSKRDLQISKILKKIYEKHPRKICLLQIGNYHLANLNLPACLKKNIPAAKFQTVLQSPDELYFRYLKKHKTVPDFFKLEKNKWAIMTVLPWVKWQNYVLWLESKMTFESEQSIDLMDYIARFVQFISDETQLSTVTSELNITRLSCLNADLDFKLLSSSLKNRILSQVKSSVDNKKSIYIPEIKKGFLENYSLTQMSQLAAEYFLCQKYVYTKSILDPQKNFVGLIWLEMLIYFLTKIINPKRKSNTVFDMRTFLMTENFEDHGKDVLSVALQQKLKEMSSSQLTNLIPSNLSNFRKVKPQRSSKSFKTLRSYRSAARLLGGILGEKVFEAYLYQRFSLPQGSSFLFQNIYHKSFQIKYYDLIEIIDSWPNQSKSKFDQF